MGAVVAVVEAQLLLAVSRIIRGIEVENDLLGTLPQATPVTFDHRVGDRVHESI